MSEFSLGDSVVQTSQSGGHYKTKIGIIVGIIWPGDRPSCYDFPGLFDSYNKHGIARDHESYVVQVGKQFYQPLVSNLKRDRKICHHCNGTGRLGD